MAARAGVAVSTASHVFSRTVFVTPATRAIVLTAADDLGYEPRLRSRSRSPVGTLTAVGVITRWSHQASAANPFFGPVLQGVEQVCRTLGLSLTLEVVEPDPDGGSELPVMVRRGRVQGVLAVSVHDPVHLHQLIETGIGCVLVDHAVEDPAIDCVRDDDERSGYLATRHLLEHGHLDPVPAIVAGPSAMTSMSDRVAGYRRALAEFGRAVDPAHLRLEADLNIAGGRAAMAALLALPTRPTAVFCCTDTLAIGALATLRDHGLRVPDDVSVIGHDDIDMAAHTDPPLTTMRVDKRLLGAQAVWHLVQRVAEPGLAVRDTRLRVSLVPRASVTHRPA
ncbi:LacI family DNA-binding transcriptional regulator [Dactylosporangium siamense]|uniref:LacI family DNA-binding transcriptional regulator n=1 Tax=Dactylosporangium siamense TaxID=685454 RepID=UPI001943785B|nr:LacI family DNA-binding transcriptional regulator [Dactylosporangium siamense]